MLECVSFFDELRWQNKFKGLYATYQLNDEKIVFLQPFTYMNLSGESVAPACHFFKIEPDQVLAIHDELELDFGVVGFKRNGGLAGHNGLRSLATNLGTRDFNRFRLGISRPAHRDITSYVLGNFAPDEQVVLPTYLEKAAALLEECLSEGFEYAATQYKKTKVIETG